MLAPRHKISRATFVPCAGKVDGIVAEIKGNNSVDLLSSGTPNYLQV